MSDANEKGISGKSPMKLIWVAVGIVVLAAILGGGAYFFLNSQDGTIDNNSNPVVPTAPSTPTTSTTEATSSPISAVGNEDVFVPRNPFKVIPSPTVVVSPSTTTTKSTETTTTNNNNNNNTNNDSDSNTLRLLNIITSGGSRKAVVRWNGNEYTLGAGGTIPGSSWKIVAVNSSSVDFLYGSDRLTIGLSGSVSK